MNYCIEIATTDYPTTLEAVKGGADRIELCSAISEGGLTPSYGMTHMCMEKFDVPLFPIIRPRSGDFLYNDEEFEIIRRDITVCKQLNCKGIVTGFLNADGTIDVKKLEQVMEVAHPMEVTFHRAFDRCNDPFDALEKIINAGCKRILTSGQQLKAADGAPLIKQLVEAARGRIIIMPGSGVRPENIKQLAATTGAVEFHGALRNITKSSMEFVVPAFVPAGDYVNAFIDESEVRAMKDALLQIELK